MKYTPRALIAEITHRCPLHCVYCSNPLEMQRRADELSTGDWVSVFQQAGEMGVLQLHLTGGEPLSRADLTELVRAGREAQLYLNLIISGVGLDERRLDELIDAGLDHIQLSFQDSEEAPANEFAGARSHALKLRLARESRKDLDKNLQGVHALSYLRGTVSLLAATFIVFSALSIPFSLSVASVTEVKFSSFASS